MGTATNVFGGPAEVFVGPVGSVEPAPGTLDTLDAAWRSVGWTSGGVRQVANAEFTEYEVDQVPEPVGYRLRKRTTTVATTMAEATLDNMAVAQNQAAGTITGTEAAGRSYEAAADDMTAEPDYTAVLLRGPGPNGRTRVAVYRRCLSVESVQTENSKTEQSGIPVTWAATRVSSSVRAVKIMEGPDPA